MPKKAIERKNGVALWRQIADRIRISISAGDYAETGMLPPETVLAEKFGVNRHTVRGAIAFLAEEGLLKAEQGKGTRIQRRRKLSYPISRRTRFSEGLSDQARDLNVEFLTSAVVLADEGVCQGLGLSTGAQCIEIQMISVADGQPVSCSTHYFPQARFAGIDLALQETKSVTKAFARLGLADYVRVYTDVSARHAEADERGKLKLSPGAIVLETTAINADPLGVPVQFSRTSFAADRVSLKFDT